MEKEGEEEGKVKAGREKVVFEKACFKTVITFPKTEEALGE